jgi:TRAP-type C4-dicarboxylate transport system substrate-binding protein
MKRLFSMVFAIGMFCVAPAQAQQPVELRFAFPAPPNSPLNTQGYAEWAKDVTAASGGTLTIRIMAGPAFSTFDNVYDRILKGVADMGFGVSDSIGGQFVKTSVANLPFEFEDPKHASVALWRMLNNGLIADEFKDVKPLTVWVFGHAAIHTKNVKIKSLADVKGLKLRAGGKLEGDIISALGASPVTLNPTEIYQSIASGLIEGAVVQWTATMNFKIYEVAKNHLRAPLNSSTSFVVMNKQSYEKLPPQAKAAIDKYSGEHFARRMGELVSKMDADAQETARKTPGQVIETVPAAEAAAWRKQLEGVVSNWVKTTPNGAAVLAGWRSEMRKVLTEK